MYAGVCYILLCAPMNDDGSAYRATVLTALVAGSSNSSSRDVCTYIIIMLLLRLYYTT
jgi:hypothetical protein